LVWRKKTLLPAVAVWNKDDLIIKIWNHLLRIME
jgi:hypothetical protein